ncbi:MAG: hypothetical protein EAX96_00670 [Candidatus Lokiarchaeota archaeon]|nr:hypothetical protein [Candidatus Lokiarchaeota archaeon]
MIDIPTSLDFYPTLLDFLEKEKIAFTITKKSESEFWIEPLQSDIITYLTIDELNHKIFYEIYSSEDDEYLEVNSIKDVEKFEFIEESRCKWNNEKAIEEIWLVLDEIKLWAFKNNYKIIEKEMI